MLAVVTEVLSHGASRVWGEELKRSGVRGSGSHDGGVLHGTGIFELLHDLGNGGALLANSDVDAVECLGISSLVHWLLVDDGVNGYSSLACLTVTNNKLTLASTDWDKSIHGLQSVCIGSLTDCRGIMPGALTS